MDPQTAIDRDRQSGGLIAMIVDEDTSTGMLLTGLGHIDLRRRSSFLIVNDSECSLVVGNERKNARKPFLLLFLN